MSNLITDLSESFCEREDIKNLTGLERNMLLLAEVSDIWNCFSHQGKYSSM